MKKHNASTRKAGLESLATMVLFLVIFMASGNSSAATRTWDGGGANSNASTAANWSGDMSPVTGDAIVLDTTTHKNMIWDLDVAVASWRQVGYTGTVEVATVYPGQGAFTNFTILGDCVISNGVWTQTTNPNVDYEVNRLCLMINGNLVIGPAGAIDVTGKGYAPKMGPGSINGESCSASYGGRGKIWYGSGPVRPCYGSIVAPTNLGSGGGSGGSGSVGGGAILFTVGGKFCNDGLIASDGNPAGRCSGSGGSIWLVSGTISGTGTIRAHSGIATHPGGGGRIALTVTNAGSGFSLFTGAVFAISGGKGSGAGTIYLRTASQGDSEGTLIVDNDNQDPSGHTEVSSNVTGTVVCDVIVRGQGVLALATNQTLIINGTWSNDANFIAQSGAQVIFAGAPASTSVLYGSSTFMGLVCTNSGGKTILFEAGKTNTIVADGQLTLMGDAVATNLILRSTSDGVSWKLNVNGAAAQSVRCVDVKNSDALPGTPIGAFNSKDRGGNFNWAFSLIGQTNAWTGANNAAWNLGANWSLGHAPLTEDFVLIPSACPRYPVLDTAKTLTGGLKIETGAALSLAGYNLTVKTNAVIAGTLTASNTETITFLADVDFAGGAFTPADSALVVGGAGNQAVNLANQSFYRINVTNNSGTVTFGSGFSAGELRCEAAEGVASLVFQQGDAYILRSLVLLGSLVARNISLRSSFTGQKWNLSVSGGATALGVDVQDSDASGGKPVRAISSKDSSGNSNWFFNENWSVWIGTNGAGFHEAANWFPAGVPGATSRALIEGANAASVTVPATILELAMGGSLTISAKLKIVEDLTVQSGGTVAMDRPVAVGNDVYVLAGGTLTHSANTTTEDNKLNLTVRGDMSVDTNAFLDVTGKGYAGGAGPGRCGSHGGRAGDSWVDPGPCYGSILAPTNLGSGGSGVPGGGAILLAVGGYLIHDGLMVANGINANTASSGGSIRLTCGSLSGAGAICANGGVYSYGSPGGGRIALVVTNAGEDFHHLTGPVTAFGGHGSSPGGAGTVYWKRAADWPRRGIVCVNNNGHAGYTDVPPYTNYVPGEVEFVSFHITNAATLRITNDFMLGDIWLDSTNSRLDLGSNTLTVRSKEHSLGSGSVTNYGQIIWWPYVPKGTMYFAR